MSRTPLPFDEELAEEICDRIATSDLGLEDILSQLAEERLQQQKTTPCLRTIYRWLESNESFSQRSARARTLQAQLLHDRAQRYAREALIGTIERTEDGPDGKKTTVTRSDNVERSKLLVQTTLRRAGQLDPKKYGERITAEHTGPGGGPLQIVSTIPRPPEE